MNTINRPAPDDVIADPLWVGVLADSVVRSDTITEYLRRTGQVWEGKTPGQLTSASSADLISEFAGRICYQSFSNPRPGGSAAYLENIKQSGHGSVLEHAVVTFVITGVSRNLTHELVRHRAGFGFSQLSQRYVSAENVRFVPPYDLWDMPGALYEWRTSCQQAAYQYRTISDILTESPKWSGLSKTDRRKHIRQAARSVLPGCTETQIVVTANMRAWRHFLAQRGSDGAEVEIRALAAAIARELDLLAPLLMSDVRGLRCDDGVDGVQLTYPKV